MSETRTAAERLDAMLAGLEDDVLGTGAANQGELGETGAREGVERMRADIEALIGSVSGPATAREAERGVGVHALGMKAKAKVAETMARLGRRVGLGPHAGGESAAPRVRMAFSGAPAETGEKEERNEASRGKGAPGDEAGERDG